MPSSSRLAFVCLALLYIHQVSAWDIVPVSGVAPSIRSWPALASTDDGLISFGGAYDNFDTGIFTFYNDLRSYNPWTHHWTLLNPTGDIPSERMVVARAFDSRQNRYYIYGGTKYNADFSEVDIYGDFYYYDVDDNNWVAVVPANSGPGPRTGAVMTIQGNNLYVFGGLDAYFGGKSDLWQYNFRTNRWTELIPHNRLAPRPTGMQYSPIHYFLGDIIIGSGEGGVENGFAFINEWWKFNLLTKTWTPFTSPTAMESPETTLLPPSFWEDSSFMEETLPLPTLLAATVHTLKTQPTKPGI